MSNFPCYDTIVQRSTQKRKTWKTVDTLCSRFGKWLGCPQQGKRPIVREEGERLGGPQQWWVPLPLRRCMKCLAALTDCSFFFSQKTVKGPQLVNNVAPIIGGPQGGEWGQTPLPQKGGGKRVERPKFRFSFPSSHRPKCRTVFLCLVFFSWNCGQCFEQVLEQASFHQVPTSEWNECHFLLVGWWGECVGSLLHSSNSVTKTERETFSSIQRTTSRQ